MDKLVVLHILSLVWIMQLYIANGQGITKCSYDSGSCSCDTNLGTIDLSRATKDSPYMYSEPTTLDLYYWQPCKDFTFEGMTAGAFQKVFSTRISFSLGIHSDAFSDVQDGYARFNMNGGNKSRSTFVKCICGSGDTFVYVDENPKLSYNLEFTSNACCPFSSSSGLSIGTIIVIIFCALLVVYFLSGTLFQVFIRKAQGRERIPNIARWGSIFGLIKDGFVFTFTCGKGSSYRKM